MSMVYRKNIIVILILTVILNIALTAQEINVTSMRGARNAALGDANISEANDISSMYLNPASLLFLRESSVFINHGFLRNKFGMTENLAFPVIQKIPWAVFIGVQGYHLGYIQELPDFPKQQIIEFGNNVSFARAITPTFGVGATAGFRYGETNLTKVLAPYFSVGLNYSPSADINYGAVLNGLGDYIQYLPADSIKSARKVSSQKSLTIGASMRYPSSSSLRRTILVLAIANEKIFGKAGIYYKGGIEVSPWEYLFLRFGYVIGRDVDEPRFGAGLNFNNFVIEYVINTGKSSGLLSQISFSIKI